MPTSDITVTSKLDEIARFLEDSIASAPEARNDPTIGARLQRILDAMNGGALSYGGTIPSLALPDLSDVSAATSPGAAQFLRGDGLEWVDAAIQLSDLPSIGVGDLSDVNAATTPLSGQYFRGDGSEWVNSAILLADLPAISLSDLDDVALGTSPLSGYYLRGNGSEWSSSQISVNDVTGVVRTDGTAALTAAWNAVFGITAGTLTANTVRVVDTTASLFRQLSNLKMQLTSSDKDILFSVNHPVAGQRIPVYIDATGPSLVLDSDTSIALGTSGIIRVINTWTSSGVWGMMDFNPTVGGTGQSIGFRVRPAYDPSSGTPSHLGFDFQPSIAATKSVSLTGLDLRPAGLPTAGTTYIGVIDELPRTNTATTGTMTLYGARLGNAGIGVGTTTLDTHLDLRGGASSFVSGAYTQYGIRMTGYATATSGGGTATVYALHSNGGIFALAADNQHLRFGAGQDAYLYYDGTDMIIDPDVMGSGRVLIGATGDDDMRLNTIEIDADLNHDGSNVGLYGVAPVAQASALTAALTSITHTGPTTPDYAIAAPVDSGVGSAWGFSTQDEFETLMSVVLNNQTRIAELEGGLDASTGIGVFA